MHAFGDSEKRALLEKGNAFCMRPVTKKDAPSIQAIIRNTIEHPLSTASLDAVPSLDKIESSIQANQQQNLLYAAAADIASDAMFGLVNLVPYIGRPAGSRTCFDRAASVYVMTAGEQILGTELDLKVKNALIDHALTECCTGSSGFRTIVVDLLVRRNHSEHGLYLDKGFKVAGTLEDIAEKNGLLLDQIFLQYKVEVAKQEQK